MALNSAGTGVFHNSFVFSHQVWYLKMGIWYLQSSQNFDNCWVKPSQKNCTVRAQELQLNFIT
jgi:hypothetical protein